jgi:hypothetical protein
MFISRIDAFTVSALIGALALAGCGGDKSSPEEANGGTGATAGSPSAGSGTGGTTNAGSGNGGAAPTPQSCSQTAPPNNHISTFVPWNNGSWGAQGDLTGGQSLYQGDTASAITATVDNTVADPALHLAATVTTGGYSGYVMWFGPCVDASAYSGISFDISGSLGGATLAFQVQMNDDYPIDVANKKGACTGGSWTQTACWNNRAAVTVTADPTTVSFTWAELTGGYPTTPIDPRQLLGIQWEANCSGAAACVVDLTLDNVQFTP